MRATVDPHPRASASAMLVLGVLAAVLAAPHARAAAPGETTRVSVSSDGTQGDDASGRSAAGGGQLGVAISADGRFVAFFSEASNLVPDDTNGHADIFVHDRRSGTTSRVSVASDGAEADAPSTAPSISADGRHVAFQSRDQPR